MPTEVGRLLPVGIVVDLVAGVLFGRGIGLISSLLGVAGGEVIIPTLVFAYGADIKIAGTASLLISLPTVAVGITRYARQAAFDRRALRATVVPMGLGSIIGAVIGAGLVGVVPAQVLKTGLSVILIISAVRVFQHRRPLSEPRRSVTSRNLYQSGRKGAVGITPRQNILDTYVQSRVAHCTSLRPVGDAAIALNRRLAARRGSGSL